MGLRRRSFIFESVYSGNLGFEEMMMFYKKASESEISKMESLLSKNKFEAVFNLLQRVLGVGLMRSGMKTKRSTVARQDTSWV